MEAEKEERTEEYSGQDSIFGRRSGSYRRVNRYIAKYRVESEAPGAPGGRPRPDLYSISRQPGDLVIHILLFFPRRFCISNFSLQRHRLCSVLRSLSSPFVLVYFIRKPTQVESGDSNYKFDTVRILDPAISLHITSKLSWCS